MVAKNVCYFFLFQSLVIYSMNEENKQLSLSTNGYETFIRNSTPAVGGCDPEDTINIISSIPSLNHSCNTPHSIDISMDLENDDKGEIVDLNDNEVSFLVKACKFTRLKDVSKKHAKEVILANAHHPRIQKIISAMRQQKVDPDEVHIDHDKEVVRSGGVDLGIDVKDIHKIYYDLAGFMWKKDHTCCGRTISQTTGQKIIANGLTVFTVGGLMAYNLFLVISNYENTGQTINNYNYYNCTNGTNSYLG